MFGIKSDNVNRKTYSKEVETGDIPQLDKDDTRFQTLAYKSIDKSLKQSVSMLEED